MPGCCDAFASRAVLQEDFEPVAQLVEHRTFNAVVAGSSPARLTIRFNKIDGLVVLVLG